MLVWIQNVFAFVNGLRFLCRSRALFIGPTSTNFSKFFFEIGSHSTIHSFTHFKIILLHSFQFSVFSNKWYPANRPLVNQVSSRWWNHFSYLAMLGFSVRVKSMSSSSEKVMRVILESSVNVKSTSRNSEK